MKIAKCTFFFVYLWSAFFTSNFSFSQNIIDNCFQSSNPSIQFGSTANMFNTTSSDLLQWTGTTWIGGWPAAALTIPPPTNLIGCRAVFIGSGSAWTTGGEAFALRLDAPLIAGSSYSFDFTYVSHGLGSDGVFSPKIYTNSFGPLSGAYDTGNLQPVGYNWETHTFSFIANAAQAGHTWIIINTTSVGSSGLINSFCQNCNATTQVCGVSVNSQSICQGSMANITATPTISGTYNYAWTVPTGFTNPGNVSNFSANLAGNYSVVITDIVTGCVSLSASGTVTINATPIVSVNSQSICQGSTANITATPTISGTYNYVWTVPTGFTNPGNVSNFSTNVAGNYSVVITDIVTGCVSLSASGTVPINIAPIVSVNSQSICQGSTANITATPTASGTYNYVWTVPTGFTNPGNVSNFSTNVAGNYSVVITDIVTGCVSLSASGTVTINATPIVSVNSQSICEGSTANITATPTVSGTYNYVWTVPTGFTNPGNVSNFSTNVAGNYSVVITDIVTGCVSLSASGTVPINIAPIVSVNSQSICQGSTANITATSTVSGTYNYVWTVPTGFTNPGNVSNFSTNVAGNYSVVITDIVTGCVSLSASGIVTINTTPIVSVNSQSICQGATENITATPNISGTYNYVWTVPIGFTNPGNVSNFSTNVAGNYSVVITDIVSGCVSFSASGTVTINTAPIVSVNSQSICEGSTANITATPTVSGTYNYVWTVPTGFTNPGNVSNFSTNVAGNYSVVITDIVSGCVSFSASGTVTINTAPIVSVNSQSICEGSTANITATPTFSGTYNYLWTVPTGFTNPGNVSSFSTNVAGNYSVVITDIVSGCVSLSASGIVTINTTPIVSVNSQSICQGATANITATPTVSGTYNYVWTVPTGFTNPGNVSNFSTNVAGNYSVVITDIVSGCVSFSASGTVTINTAPIVSVNSQSICEGSTANITATPTFSGTYNYLWTVPTGFTNPGNVSSFSTNVAGNYSVVITDIVSGCVSLSASGIVTINTTPIVSVNSQSICQGATANITATPTVSGTYNYVWTVPTGFTNPGNVSNFSTNVAGNYSVVITDIVTGCVSLSASGVMDYYPDFDYTINKGCLNNKYILEISALNSTFDVSTVTYNWQNQDLISIGNDVSLDVTSYLNSTSIIEQLPLTITAIVTNLNGCQKSSKIIIDQIYCEIQRGISPNNDNLNDFFDLTLLNVRQLKIFNRYGTMVYSHYDYKNEWYGQSDNGSELVDGVYYYLIDFNTPVESKTGWIYINK